MDDSEVAVAFRSEHPYTACWLNVRWRGDRPTALFDALRQIGWAEELRWVPPVEGWAEADFTKRGTGPQGWTSAERRSLMAQARRVLYEHGFDRVPVVRLGLEDLL